MISLVDQVEIEKLIQEFQNDLQKYSAERIVQKRITFGSSYILSEDLYFDLKASVSEHFHISTNEVLIVGSGKLGFSIAPTKRYRHFSDTSDVDIALISSDLFDDIWKIVFDYKNDVGYWEEEDEFKKYLFKGWIRPDKLPPSPVFKFRKDWWDFFRLLTSSNNFGPFQIRGALYKSWEFLEDYQCICVKSCQEDLIS